MCCLDLCTAIILPAWRAAMEAVQGLLKGSIWTQNGGSAAQLSGNMSLSVWKGAGGEEGKSSVLFSVLWTRGIENWALFSEDLGECRGSLEQHLVVHTPWGLGENKGVETFPLSQTSFWKWSSADIPCGQSTWDAGFEALGALGNQEHKLSLTKGLVHLFLGTAAGWKKRLQSSLVWPDTIANIQI